MPTATRSAWMNAWECDLTPSPAARRSEARHASAHVRSSRFYTREATARVPQPLERPQQTRPLPELKVVTRRKPRWGVALVAMLFSALLLGVIIVAPVLINSATTQVESDIGQLQSTQQHLAAETAALSAHVSALSSPDRVAEQASRLGLGPAQSVNYVETATETAETAAEAAATEGDTTVAGR